MVIGGAASIFPSRSPIRFNVDYTDVVGEVGYVSYDGTSTTNNATDIYVLIPTNASGIVPIIDSDEDDNLFLSRTPTYTTFDANGTTTKNFDFDLSPFLKPVTIQGKVYISFILAGHVARAWTNLTAKTLVRKFDGSIETDLGSENRAAFTIAVGKRATFLTIIELSKTKFKIGELLRISLELTFTDPAQSTEYGLFHNPSDTAISQISSTMKGIAGGTRFSVAVPYRLP